MESQEAKDNKMHEVGSGGIDCFNELIPILQYVCSRLDEAQRLLIIVFCNNLIVV